VGFVVGVVGVCVARTLGVGVAEIIGHQLIIENRTGPLGQSDWAKP